MTSQFSDKSKRFTQLLSANIHRIVTSPSITSNQKVLPSIKRVDCNLWSMIQSLDAKIWLNDVLESAEEEYFKLIFIDHTYDVIKEMKEVALRSAIRSQLAKVVIVNCFDCSEIPKTFPHMFYKIPKNLNELTTELVRTIFNESIVANILEILEIHEK